nr:DUF3426 domain-containing protein [uncultured Desulfobacter sp.]
MIITCEVCSTQFILDDTLIKPEGSKVKCSKCRHIFTAFPPDHPNVEVPDEPKPQEHDIPFDEQAFQDDSDFNKSQNDDFSLDSDTDSDNQDADLEDTDIDFSEIEFDEPEFDEPELQQEPPELQTDAVALDSQDQDIEIEDPAENFDEDGLDFATADFEIDEPELDFQDDNLELDTQDFEFENIDNGTISGPAPVSTDSDTDTADIEISFAQDDDADEDLELEELSLDMDDLSIEESSIDDLELDTKKDESSELDFDDDAQTDLILENDDLDLDLSLESEEAQIDDSAQQQGDIIEEQPDIKYDSLLSDDVELESDESEEPSEERDEQEADEEIAQPDTEQDKFAEYDTVLEQETEPEDADITIAAPDVKDSSDTPENQLPPTDDEIDTEASIDQAPLITPPSAQSVRQKRSARKKKGGSLAVKILLVLFLLIIVAYVAIIRLGVTIPVVSDIQIPFITEWLEPKQPAPQPPLKPVIDEPSIDGRFVSNKSAGDLFIVTGRIENPSNTAVSHIQVKGTLMTKDNTKAATLIAYCGNIIPEETLKSGNISDITKQMGVKQGHQNTNVDIKPGASVRFMLVFSNLPEDLSNFTVAMQGFEPAQE